MYITVYNLGWLWYLLSRTFSFTSSIISPAQLDGRVGRAAINLNLNEYDGVVNGVTYSTYLEVLL